MLILSRKIGESIIIEDKIEISVVDIKGDQIKLGIEAPKNVKIYRMEVYNAIQNENREAAGTSKELLPDIKNMFSGVKKKDDVL
jgi:carbon storage regulator